MLEQILSALSNPTVLRALIAIVLISILAATAGSFSVFRGLSFLVAGVAHASLAGAALAVLLEQYGLLGEANVTIFALLAGIFLALFVAFTTNVELREQMETAIGIAFAFSMSLALLFISLMKEYSVEAWALILGDIYLLTPQDIVMLTIITVIVAFFFVILLREFIFISFDPEGTNALGVNIKMYNILMLVLIASATVVLLRGVGAILVYAVLVVPPAIASRLAGDVIRIMLITFLIALAAGLLGILLSFIIPAAPSAIIGVILTILYFIVYVVKRNSVVS